MHRGAAVGEVVGATAVAFEVGGNAAVMVGGRVDTEVEGHWGRPSKACAQLAGTGCPSLVQVRWRQ